jgi:hypothetical protein
MIRLFTHAVGWTERGRDHHCPLAEGRHGKDDDRADARGRLPPQRPRGALRRPRPAGQPVRLLRRARGRVADDRRRAGRADAGLGCGLRRRAAGQPGIGRSRAGARRQDGPRADAQARPARGQARIRPGAGGLPAVARAADGKRAGGRRSGADHERGGVLLPAGGGAGARGGGAGPGVAPPRSRVAGRGAQHRRHAAGALARGAALAAGAASATPSRPSAGSRSSTTRPTSAPTTWRWRRRPWSGWVGSTRHGSGWPAPRSRRRSRLRRAGRAHTAIQGDRMS